VTHHLLLKYHYKWETPAGDVNTMEEHQAIASKYGSCWWGRTSPISQGKADQLKAQLDANIETWLFLYAIWVPRKVHEDRTLWFVGRLKGISLERPSNLEQIPSYYREKSLDCYFLVADITPISFAPGATPKVPGQAAMRHLTLDGSPLPANIRFGSEESRKGRGETSVSVASPVSSADLEGSDAEEFKSRIIDLQAEIIRLQEHVSELRTYKDYYQKILNTDYLFSSEKFLESWLQENMHKILPELHIMDRQPSIKWSDGKFGRLDLLAMNRESKDLCIIEVKTRKRSTKSGYDQFIRYTSWAKRSKDLLAKTYSEYDLKPTDHPSFVIITDYIDEEMTAICNDHGITLIHVFGGLGFEKVTK
jgi:hypothetical protein